MACSFPIKPNPSGDVCTKQNKHFKELRYAEKIAYCYRSVSTSLKKKIYNSYGIDWEDREHYTIDHIIPLSLGGSNSEKNLWPEHISLKMKYLEWWEIDWL